MYTSIHTYIEYLPGRDPRAAARAIHYSTVGAHNVNLIIFNLRVSNPNKLIVDFVRHDVGFQCARVSAKQKHDEISEIDGMTYECIIHGVFSTVFSMQIHYT